jgi:glycosyltransferase involved in cell wall biosynthesis
LVRAVVAAADGCDVIHSHYSSRIGAAAAEAAERLDLPLVAEVRFDLAGAMLSETLRTSTLTVPLERVLRWRFERYLSHARQVVAASYSLANLLERYCGIVPGRLTVVPNGVDVATDIAATDPAPLRRQLGIRPGELVVGSTSNMLRYEGLGALLETATRIGTASGGRIPVCVLLVGDGAQRPVLEQRATVLDVSAVFTGRVPYAQVAVHLRAMDVFAVPRFDLAITRYASPIKVVEAMAQERAVVASGVGDLPAMLADGRGSLVPPDDGQAFTNAVHALALDPAKRQAMGRRARDWVLRELPWDRLVRRYSEVYKTALT